MRSADHGSILPASFLQQRPGEVMRQAAFVEVELREVRAGAVDVVAPAPGARRGSARTALQGDASECASWTRTGLRSRLSGRQATGIRSGHANRTRPDTQMSIRNVGQPINRNVGDLVGSDQGKTKEAAADAGTRFGHPDGLQGRKSAGNTGSAAPRQALKDIRNGALTFMRDMRDFGKYLVNGDAESKAAMQALKQSAMKFGARFGAPAATPQPMHTDKPLPEEPQMPAMPQMPQQAQQPQMPQMPQQAQQPQMPQMPQQAQQPQMPQMPQQAQQPQMPQIPQVQPRRGKQQPRMPQQAQMPQMPQMPQIPQIQPRRRTQQQQQMPQQAQMPQMPQQAHMPQMPQIPQIPQIQPRRRTQQQQMPQQAQMPQIPQVQPRRGKQQAQMPQQSQMPQMPQMPLPSMSRLPLQSGINQHTQHVQMPPQPQIPGGFALPGMQPQAHAQPVHAPSQHPGGFAMPGMQQQPFPSNPQGPASTAPAFAPPSHPEPVGLQQMQSSTGLGQQVRPAMHASATPAASPALQTTPIRPTATPNQPVESQPAMTQVVNEKTTILDMVRWNTKSIMEEAGDAVVLGNVPNDAMSKLKQFAGAQDAGINLGIDTGQMSASERAKAQTLGKQAAVNMLNNTIKEYKLQGTEVEASIREQIAYVGAPHFKLTLRALGDVTKAVSEAVHAHATGKLGASTAEREAGRMPMECMTHLGSAIQQAMQTASPQQRSFLSTVGDAVQSRVMRHDLTFDRTKEFLATVQKDCERMGLGSLGELTRKMQADIPDPAQAEVYQTRLHDNMYGRAMESVLMAELVHNPPANVMHSMETIGKILSGVLNTQPLQAQEAAASRLQGMMRHERRAWQAQSPALERFVGASSPREALGALHAMLAAPVKNGIDCIVIPYASVKLSICMQTDNQHVSEWMAEANELYGGAIHDATSRIIDEGKNDNRKTKKAGITMHHQPSIVQGEWMEGAMHPGDRNRPDLQDASPEVKQALQHGVAFASGVSGSTNIMMHMVGKFKSKGIDIDAKDALLGTMMFINYDGGHSMHEALWVANHVDQTLNLGIGMPGGDPRTYVADYKQFLDSFPPHKGGDQLRAAADKAWGSTLAHFREHSHYAKENGRGSAD